MRVVVDTSPLVFLSKLGYLSHLGTIFQKIHMPMAVYKEVSAKKDEVYREIEMLIEGSVMVVEEVVPTMSLKNLHTGEAEAIMLAKRLNYWVVLDDLKAREIARREGLRVIGTAGLLKVMIKKGLIEEPPEGLFKKLAAHGFRLKRNVFLEILENNQHY